MRIATRWEGTAHRFAFLRLKYSAVLAGERAPVCPVRVMGLSFPGRIGAAAGLDRLNLGSRIAALARDRVTLGSLLQHVKNAQRALAHERYRHVPVIMKLAMVDDPAAETVTMVDALRAAEFDGVLAAVQAAGGSISAEHGVGQLKRDEIARRKPSIELATMRAIKGMLDPFGLMNPGKVLQESPAGAFHASD